MNDKRIDLNLLTVFQAVMQEQSVTRAASRLGMTQPAASNALSRLRHLFGDELFVKVPGGVTPTTRARMLWEELAGPISAIRRIATPAVFAPEETRGVFKVAVTDSLVGRVVPEIARRFMHEAPNARLHFLPHTNPASTQALERGEIDCAVGMFPNPPSTLLVEGLMVDSYVCVFSRDQSSMQVPVALEAFVAAKHVLVKQATGDIGIVDSWLTLKGLSRDVVLIVNSCAEAMALTASTDMLAAVPRSFVMSSPLLPQVRVSPLPFDSQKILYKLAWLASGGRSPRDQWFRGLVASVVRGFAEEST